MERLFTDFKSVTTGTRARSGVAARPVVGLSVNIAEETSRLHEAYVNAVSDAGGVPVLIPASVDIEILARSVEGVDALILTGGADVAGEYFGEKTHPSAEVVPLRDAYDFLLLRLAVDRQLPVFGICRGMQVINIAFGGDIWQDLPSQYPDATLPHSVLTPREKPCHEVEIVDGTVLADVLGTRSTGVNSRHHQAVRRVAEGFRIAAVAPDGVFEAIEAYPDRRIMGVQWHPENMATEGGSAEMKALFRFFVSEAELFRRAKRIHDTHLTVDSHCDTPMLFAEHNIDIGVRSDVALVDLPKMEEGKLDAEFIVAYIPQGPRDEAANRQAQHQAVGLLGEMKRQIDNNIRYCGQARTFAEADRIKAEGRKAIFLGIENGYAIGRDINNLEKFAGMGVVYMTLCHNGDNDICDSARGGAEHGGLSGFGREVVREMNRLGMVADLSHAAESTFYDVLALSSAPVICSHSSVRALCDHPRNLTDDQIRAIAGKAGVVQVCLYGGFLKEGGCATLQDAIRHIEYVARLVGPDHVGIGSDFDGDGGVWGCNGANEIINITVELLRRGYPEGDVAKIIGGNLRRVVDAVQKQRGDKFQVI